VEANAVGLSSVLRLRQFFLVGAVVTMSSSRWSLWCSAGALTTRGVVVNFDFGEQFPRPTSQQRGSLRSRARRVAVLGVRAGRGRRLPLMGSGVSPPEIFDTKSRVRGQFGPENKLIEGRPNAYDVICRNASVLTFHLWPTIFAGASFRLQNICRNGGSTAFPHHYTPAFYPHQGGSEYRPKNDSGCKTLQ